jgi:hypothetical protein
MNAITNIQRTAQNSCPDESYKIPPSLTYNASVTRKEREKRQRKESKMYRAHHQLLNTSYRRLYLPRFWLAGVGRALWAPI